MVYNVHHEVSGTVVVGEGDRQPGTGSIRKCRRWLKDINIFPTQIEDVRPDAVPTSPDFLVLLVNHDVIGSDN